MSQSDHHDSAARSGRRRQSSAPAVGITAAPTRSRQIIRGGLALLLLAALAPGAAAPQQPRGIVRGHVVDETGRPLADAVVDLEGGGLRWSQRTDANGTVVFAGLTAGRRTIAATWVGYDTERLSVAVPDSTLEVTIPLRRLGQSMLPFLCLAPQVLALGRGLAGPERASGDAGPHAGGSLRRDGRHSAARRLRSTEDGGPQLAEEWRGHRVESRRSPAWSSIWGSALKSAGRTAPQQKGSIENLVGWVKGSFFKQRRFVDEEDLRTQLRRVADRGQHPAALAGDRHHPGQRAAPRNSRACGR